MSDSADNNNDQRPSGRYNTRSRASLSSQHQPDAQDDDDLPSSPIRRVAQVQQQVEQAIQQELDTIHVFDEVPQAIQGVLPNSFGSVPQAQAQDVPVAQAQPHEGGGEDDGAPLLAIAEPVPPTGMWVQRRGATRHMTLQEIRVDNAIEHLARSVSQLLTRYDEGSTRMDEFITQTSTNFAGLRASTREDIATVNNTVGDRIGSTNGRLDTLGARLTNMEEHGLSTNKTLSMLERKINQNNENIVQEITLLRQNITDMDKSLISVHKKVKDLDSRSSDLNTRMQTEFATIYTRLEEVQNNLTKDSDSKIASLQSDIDALTGSINARIAKEMDVVLTTMEERFASLRAESLTDEAEIEEFKADLKKAKQLVGLAEKEHKAIAIRYADYMSTLSDHRKQADNTIKTTRELLNEMKDQIEEGKKHSTHRLTWVHSINSSPPSRHVRQK